VERFGVIIPILIFSIPVLAIIFNGLTKLARVRAETLQGVGGDVLERLNELEGEVQDLRHQLTETQERLDFAERLLAKPKDRAAT
jgi:chromosome segregation ATPase